MRLIEFEVIDNLTGREPDYEEIIGNEEWAEDLIWCDVEGLAITENRSLILADECGRFAYVPEGRFTIKVNEDSLRPKGRWTLNRDGSGTCSECHRTRNDVWDMDTWDNYCAHCGADMRGDE